MKKISGVFALLLVLVSCKESPKDQSNKTNDSDNQASNLKYFSSPADTASAEPYLFTDKNGLVYLSWIEKKREISSLKFSMLKDGQWSEPLLIASGNNWFVNWADYPLLASDAAGNLMAHFLEKSESGKYTYDVKLVSSADLGKTWTTPRILHDDGKKAEHGFVSMLPFEGNYFVSWLDGRNAVMEGSGGHDQDHHGEMTLRAAIVDKQGNKSGEWEIDNRVCDCCQTSAAITTNGPVVVYRNRSEEEVRDISIVRRVNGQWTSPKPVFSDNWTIKGCPVNGPRVDAIDNNLVVAWFSSPDKNSQVNVIFSKDGGASFDAPIRIDEGKGIGRVDLVMLDKNSAMVSWMEGPVIKAVKVNRDGKKQASIIISESSEARSSGFPQLTISGGSLIFAWTDEKEKRVKLAQLDLEP